MKPQQLALAAIACLAPVAGANAAGWTETVLTSFSGTGGKTPLAGLIADATGNFYGTASAGGTANDGVIFEASPPATGKTVWTNKVLHDFAGTDGGQPSGPLIADAAGNFYGTTAIGGANGFGTVFEISPPAPKTKTWIFTTLYNFTGATDGAYPRGGLIFDAAGDLYGTAAGGGAANLGAVWELIAPTSGGTAWTQSTLYSFALAPDGAVPQGGLLFDTAGNLYGTTEDGGAGLKGTVFRISPPAKGKTAWTEKQLYAFTGPDGVGPTSPLIADSAGDLYGTAEAGGTGFGTVFELTPPAVGKTSWTDATLFSFAGTDGGGPVAGLVADTSGHFYGTNSGAFKGLAGSVFELSPPVSGGTVWTEAALTKFASATGTNPIGGVVLDSAGNVYGTTSLGGKTNGGLVFKLVP
jgi:uncharacterized repeat protein (TIGR03803 family)